MGLHQMKNPLHIKGNNPQIKKTTNKMGENLYQLFI
jgi:hypothetical protein